MDAVLSERDQVREIRDAAMRFLARREYSRAELSRKLRNGSRDSDLIDSVLDQLRENGLQSDQRYVESLVRRRVTQGYGPERIAMELRQGQLDSELFQPLLEHPGFDWFQRMQEVWHKKFGPQPASGIKDRQKQIRFLRYRGFSAEQIRALLDAG